MNVEGLPGVEGLFRCLLNNKKCGGINEKRQNTTFINVIS
jgi:hypothetical protein